MDMEPMEVSEHNSVKVRFEASQLNQHESEIVVEQEGENKLGVHLGFLQVHHFYEIKFTIKDKLGEDLTNDALQNLHVKVIEIVPSEDGDGHEVAVEFTAYKEKLVREEIILTDSTDPQKSVVLVFHARVLGKGKGTPALRNGIHCTGVDPEYDSEQSDWQGFD